MIILLPTCTLPNATFNTEIDIWAVAAADISNSETTMGIQQAGLRGEPRHLMFALFLHVLVGHGGGFIELCFTRRISYDRVTDTAVFAFFSARTIFGRLRRN